MPECHKSVVELGPDLSRQRLQMLDKAQNRHGVMFLAGEPSGDEHAAPVIRHLKRLVPGCTVFGVGGPEMQNEGLRPILPFEPFGRMGIVDVVTGAGFFFTARRVLLRTLDSAPPKALVLVDYPGLNIWLLKQASKRGIPVIWYIAPKVWAWKEGRKRILGRFASEIALIFPFETSIYASFQARSTYVGNPSVEALVLRARDLEPCRREKRKSGDPFKGERPFRIALVPGSRRQEVGANLPPMIGAVDKLRGRFDIDIRVSRCDWLPDKLYSSANQRTDVELFRGSLDSLFAWADTAFVTSGTATLEAALLGVPHVLVYRTSLVNFVAAKLLFKTPFIGLPNIIAGEEIIHECFQKETSPSELARHMEPILSSSVEYLDTQSRLTALRDHLGEKKPSLQVADLTARYVNL